MQTKYYYFALLAAAVSFNSCVEDEGSNEIHLYNEVSISGIEDVYAGVSGIDVVEITPVIEGSLSGKDESNYEYKWFLCTNSITNHSHQVISTERNLSYPINSDPANYTLYFQVKDKETGLEWEETTTLKVESPFVRGFYLYGDKEDGSVGLDFISVLSNDTAVVENIFENTCELYGAKDIIFTGRYNDMSGLYATAENGYTRIEYSSKQATFKPISVPLETYVFPSTIKVEKPMTFLDIYPHAYGKANTSAARTNRLLMAGDAFYVASIYTAEQYGNPANIESGSTKTFKFHPQLMYSQYSSVYSMTVFNKDAHAFWAFGSTYFYMATYCKAISETSGSPFYFDQTKYSPVRDVVHIENGAGSRSYCYALMNDENGDHWVYTFNVSYSGTPTKYASNQIDMSVATGLKDATHYALFTRQPILVYSVGNKVYAYNYNLNQCVLVGEYDDEITYLAFDFPSEQRATDLMVVSYKKGSGSTVRKFDVLDSQNEIKVTPRPNEEWKSKLRVVKVEYRNSTY